MIRRALATDASLLRTVARLREHAQSQGLQPGVKKTTERVAEVYEELLDRRRIAATDAVTIEQLVEKLKKLKEQYEAQHISAN